MKLTELQLECMRLWADKTISFGCIFVDKYHRDNSDILQYNKVITLWNEVEWISLLYHTTDFNETYIIYKRVDFIVNEKKEYQKTQINEWDFRYEIIWHPINYSRIVYLYYSDELNNENTEKNSQFIQKVAFSAENLSDDEKKEVLKYLEFIKTHRNIWLMTLLKEI